MSALGQKQTCALQNVMSALHPIATAKATPQTVMSASPPKADISRTSCHVRCVPEADMSDLSHGDQASSLASRGDLHAKGNNCKHHPTAMKKNSRSYHQAAWNRANGGALQDIGEAS